MSRTSLNAMIDTVAYAGFVVLATTGLMFRFQLPPGSGRLHGSGTGAGSAAREIATVWGLTRHEWGDIHYWVAIGLTAVLAVHLVLHWKWIVAALKGKPHTDTSGGRFALGVAGLVLVTLLAAMPLISPSETASRAELNAPDSPQESLSHDATEMESIRGFMTLEDVSQQTGVPVADILQRLNLPADTESSEKVGRLLRMHGLDTPDLRQALRQTDHPK